MIVPFIQKLSHFYVAVLYYFFCLTSKSEAQLFIFGPKTKQSKAKQSKKKKKCISKGLFFSNMSFMSVKSYRILDG